MEGSGTGTIAADAISLVILWGAGLPEVAQALAQPLPGELGATSPT